MYKGQDKAKVEGTSAKFEPVKKEGRGNEGIPLEPSSPSFSSSSSSKESKHPSHKKNPSKKFDHNIPLLKLDVKFKFTTCDKELKAKKLEKWIKQIDV
jgi:hypothetical protein